MNFAFNFESPLYISIEETDQGVAIIKGTLLVEGVSTNQRLYEIDEMESIAKQAIGVPITCGIKKIISADGKTIRTLHEDSPENEVGRIMETFLDKVKKKITFIGHIVNTAKFPDIVKKVREGWGISIGGMVHEAHHVLDKAGRLVMKIKNMLVQHVAIVEPSISRGQKEAKVESKQIIHEVMEFDLPPVEIVIKIGKGVSLK
jgi:DNA polymerase II small subunit/DNA polymerase delta subunit B